MKVSIDLSPLRAYWKSIATTAAILAFMLLGTMFLPEPIAQNLFRQKAAIERPALTSAVERFLAETPAILTGALTMAERNALSRRLVEITGATRVILRDQNGKVRLANLPEDLGNGRPDAAFAAAISTGEANFEHMHAMPQEVGLPGSMLGSDEHEGLDVNHEVVPIKLDGQTIGAIETFKDVSAVNNSYLKTVRIVITLISAVVSLFGVVAFVWSRRAAKTFLKMSMERAEAERSSLSEQLRLAREVRILGELNEWLQSCKSLDELFDMVARFVTHLLPDYEGSIYVYSNSRDVLDGAASWNGGEHLAHIHPEDCWGLRRGRTYSLAEGEVRFACAHVSHDGAENYLCIPFLAHGETVGMMHLVPKDDVSDGQFTARRKLAQMCAEQVSLAIANVRMRDELHHQAIRDALTGLYNRRHMMDTLRRLRETKRDEPFSIISIDVDHFKKFNDNFGHDAGDTVLRSVGEVLISACKVNDIACRMGGEELMLLLPGTGTDAALVRAEEIRLAVEKLVVRYGEGNLPTITISIGVAQYPDHGDSPADVIKMADDALYVAKGSGRNCVKEAEGRQPQKLPGQSMTAEAHFHTLRA